MNKATWAMLNESEKARLRRIVVTLDGHGSWTTYELTRTD
jgi:hypothetical protein